MLVASNFGWWLGGILLFFVWVAIAFWPARVAARKGHGFFLFFVFSLFLSRTGFDGDRFSWVSLA